MPAAPVPAPTQRSDGGPTSTRSPTSTAPVRTATVRIDGEPVAVPLTEDGSATSTVHVADVALTRASIEGGSGWLEGPVDAPFVAGTARFEVVAGELTGRVQVAAGVDVLGSLVARIGYDGRVGAGLPLPEVEVDDGRVSVDVAGRLVDGRLLVEPVGDAARSMATDGAVARTSEADGVVAAAPPRDVSPGHPLPSALNEKLALLLGEPPEGLLLHTDLAAAETVRSLDASGLVAGADLYVPPGAADPQVPSGLDLLVRMVTQALAGIDGPALRADDLADPTSEAVAPQPRVAFEPPGPMGDPAREVAPAAVSPQEKAVELPQAPAPEGAATPGHDDAAAAEVPEGEEVEEPPEVELLIPPAPGEPPPEQQERIQGVSRRAGGRARSARDLPPADELTTDAREGVTEPPAETMARAEAAITEMLGEREPPSPAIVDLCDEIRTAIREKRPVDEDDLVDADPEEMAEEAGHSLNTAVQGEADQVDTSYEAIDQVEVGQPAQIGEPIPEQAPEVGGPEIDATAAAPDPIPPEDISLDADREQLDAQVEASNINRASTEPITDEPFATVREGQDQFGELAETSPAEAIAEQDAALERAGADMAGLQLQAMQALQRSRRGAVGDVGDRQQGMVGDEQVTRESLSRQATDIFTTAQTQVNALLGPLTRTAMEKWNRGVDRASTTFKTTLSRVERWIDERHEGVGGFFVAGWDAAFGLPGWVTDSYDRAERLFGDEVCDLLLEISSDVDTVITAAEELIADARRRIDDLFTQDLPAELQEWAAQQRSEFDQRLDGLDSQVSEARQDFEQQISEAAVSSVREVQEEVEALRQAARGLLGQVMDAIGDFLDDPVRAIINGLLSLVGIPPPAFWALVDKVAQVASDIADDPMNFVNNLISAIGQGFQLFFDRIGDHLLQGLFDWLFAGLGSVGVQIPAGTSVGELVTFALQLMGITWPNIREILVRHIGEENVELIEQAWELVSMLIEQGPDGIIEMLRERLAPEAIFQMVLDAAIDYVVETLIEQAARWLFSLLSPAGWVTKAIELIYQVLRWVFENAARIFRFVETIVNGMADIVAGNIGGMAAAVERALASLLPVVIDFLAGLVGLGDLPDEVVEVIKAIQTRVLAVVETIVAWLVERGRALLASLGLGAEEEPTAEHELGPEDTELGTTERFTAAGKAHRHWIDLTGDRAELMVASQRETVDERLDRWENSLEGLATEELREEAQGLISSARAIHHEADADTDALAEAYRRAQSLPSGSEGDVEPLPADDHLERRQQALARLLQRLFEIYEEEVDPLAIFSPQLELVHTAARRPVESALQEMATAAGSQIPRTWQEARTQTERDATVSAILATPLNKDNPFGDSFAHGWAAAAALDGINTAFGERTRPDGEPHRSINAVYVYLEERGGVSGDQANPHGADTYLTNHKVQVHGQAPPFDSAPPPVQRMRDMVWTRAVQGHARIRLRQTMEARVRMGIGPPPGPELPEHIRLRIWELLSEAVLAPPHGTTEVHIELSGASARAITDYIDSEIAQTGPALQRTLSWWRDNILAPEFHHAWPQWLGGPAQQTRLFIPRALHNFDGIATDGENFPGGFHQVFNTSFAAAFPDVPVNNRARWDAEVARNAEAVPRVGQLLVEAYKAVFAGFGPAGEQAIRTFVEAAKQTYPELE